MSQMSTSSTPAQRRLRLVGIGLTVLTALTFAVVTGLIFVANLGQDMGGAILQGVVWGVGAGIVSIIVYVVYKNVVVKA